MLDCCERPKVHGPQHTRRRCQQRVHSGACSFGSWRSKQQGLSEAFLGGWRTRKYLLRREVAGNCSSAASAARGAHIQRRLQRQQCFSSKGLSKTGGKAKADSTQWDVKTYPATLCMQAAQMHTERLDTT